MIYDSVWIKISIILLIFFLIVYFIWPQSNFVLPKKYINNEKKIFFLSVVFIFLFLILLLPINIWWVKSKEIVKQKNINIQLILDVSLSMAWQDISPSRFHLAKKSLVYLRSELSWYNISLITFSGKPLVYIPYTSDHIASVQKLQNTNLSDFYPSIDFVGTAMWDAMLLGLKNSIDFKKKISDNLDTVFVVITDGDTNNWNDPLFVLDEIVKNNITIFGIWIWEWTLILWKDKSNNDQNANFNTKIIKEISQKTWWEFYNIKKVEDFDDIFLQIKNIIKNSEEKKVFVKYNYLNKYTIPIVFFCIIFLFVILNKNIVKFVLKIPNKQKINQ